MKTYRHVSTTCPRCKMRLNATVDPKGRGMPRPGDLTICVQCGEILKFDNRLRLRPVTAEQIESLPKATAEELLEQQERFRAIRERRVIVT